LLRAANETKIDVHTCEMVKVSVVRDKASICRFRCCGDPKIILAHSETIFDE